MTWPGGPANTAGAGGGGGYFGGGSTGTTVSGGGGGGSGYTNAVGVNLVLTVVANTGAAANNTDPDYVSGKGVGSSAYPYFAGSGYVVIYY